MGGLGTKLSVDKIGWRFGNNGDAANKTIVTGKEN
jgi:hypothetical protein